MDLRPEPDNPHLGRALAIAGVTLSVFAVGIGYVVLVLRFTRTSPRDLGGPVPRQTGQGEIGIVDQPVFEGDVRLSRAQREQREQLDSYGWVDRDAGVVRVPIQVAIDEIVGDGGAR